MGCDRRRLPERLVCERCWNRVPPNLRDELRGACDVGAKREATNAILQWLRATNGIEDEVTDEID
jgi:hypothetical protein